MIMSPWKAMNSIHSNPFTSFIWVHDYQYNSCKDFTKINNPLFYRRMNVIQRMDFCLPDGDVAPVIHLTLTQHSSQVKFWQIVLVMVQRPNPVLYKELLDLVSEKNRHLPDRILKYSSIHINVVVPPTQNIQTSQPQENQIMGWVEEAP